MRTLRISEVAERTGVPATTLRYYEDIGLIGPAVRSANGYRNYDERDLERLAVITRAKKLDISLEDVRELVAAWGSDECGTVQHRLGGIVATRLQETRERIDELTDLDDQLEQASARLLGKPQEGACTDDCACVGSDQKPLAPPAGAFMFPLLPAAVDSLGAACTLERHALPGRLNAWTALIADATARTALKDGVALEFAHNPDLAAGLARLAAEEYECCSFFDFTIAVNAVGLRLEVRAPAQAQDALHDVFGVV
ncbi:MerR family transcriptional regulator [Pseudarthrobacter sp. H3Y2-7]|uniref:MerR family transcriptional regulator n=1 Tax=Pseudarthrobacter naphthalenicus TaxID=3031328 RepID=UPI0023B17A61|nr:MerR family transcriptional regulator [Pseudarthrobacter sp. H3Y2-7]MDE8670012.1 MerR family transcriptional regulator [Pseudarthrobacter sp. H3Y2-7]